MQLGISVWFPETFEENTRRGKPRSRRLLTLRRRSFHLLALHFKNTHSGCTLCWPTFHISIILRAGTADDFLLEFVPPVRLELQCSAFLLRCHQLSSPALGRSPPEPPSSFLSSSCSSLQRCLFFSFHSLMLISFQPVIILLYQSCHFPFFVSRSSFYFSRLFKFAPQPTAVLPICTSPVKGG